MTKFIRYCFITSAFFCFIVGNIFENFNVMLLSILFMLSANVFYSFEYIKRRFFFLIFNFVIFIFLIGRPTINMFKGNRWWIFFNKTHVYFAMYSLFLTLICIFVGAVVAEMLLFSKTIKKKYIPKISSKNIYNIRKNEYKQDFVKALRIISLILFYISIIVFFICEVEKLLFMRGREYEEFYTKFKSQLPYVFSLVGALSKYFLCVFLATMPSKRSSFIPLSLYVISAVPSLLIGIRNPVVLNILFVITYYFIRNTIDKKDVWLGKLEKTLIIIGVPLAVIFLGSLNYIRAGSKFKSGPVDLIIDFLYKQGVSFEVLCIGHASIPRIKYTGFVNYTFGPFIDYFTHGVLAQKLFGALSLGDGNNLKKALYSNSFAHRMSYVARGHEYLEGRGWGSSYLLETYADFGYWGIAIFSIILGVLLISILKLIMKENTFLSTAILVVLTNIYFMPRDAATGSLYLLLTNQFLIAVILAYVISGLMVKRYSYNIVSLKCKKAQIL